MAEAGGATSFTKADVFVKPKKNLAAFFSYIGEDGRMDDGYTEHSACPVTQGEKWIAVFWMREGVSLQDPWTTFDPSGVKMLTSAEQSLQDGPLDDDSDDNIASERHQGVEDEL